MYIKISIILLIFYYLFGVWVIRGDHSCNDCLNILSIIKFNETVIDMYYENKNNTILIAPIPYKILLEKKKNSVIYFSEICKFSIPKNLCTEKEHFLMNKIIEQATSGSCGLKQNPAFWISCNKGGLYNNILSFFYMIFKCVDEIFNSVLWTLDGLVGTINDMTKVIVKIKKKLF